MLRVEKLLQNDMVLVKNTDTGTLEELSRNTVLYLGSKVSGVFKGKLYEPCPDYEFAFNVPFKKSIIRSVYLSVTLTDPDTVVFCDNKLMLDRGGDTIPFEIDIQTLADITKVGYTLNSETDNEFIVIYNKDKVYCTLISIKAVESTFKTVRDNKEIETMWSLTRSNGALVDFNFSNRVLTYALIGKEPKVPSGTYGHTNLYFSKECGVLGSNCLRIKSGVSYLSITLNGDKSYISKFWLNKLKEVVLTRLTIVCKGMSDNAMAQLTDSIAEYTGGGVTSRAGLNILLDKTTAKWGIILRYYSSAVNVLTEVGTKAYGYLVSEDEQLKKSSCSLFSRLNFLQEVDNTLNDFKIFAIHRIRDEEYRQRAMGDFRSMRGMNVRELYYDVEIVCVYIQLYFYTNKDSQQRGYQSIVKQFSAIFDTIPKLEEGLRDADSEKLFLMLYMNWLCKVVSSET